jgi:hypothetical protein
LTSIYDNELLTMIGSNWTTGSKTSIWKAVRETRVSGSKEDIFKALDWLVSDEYLEERRWKNTIQYRRNDRGDSELGFLGIMKVFEWNQKVELDEIERLDTITETEELLDLTKDGKELLDHVQDQVDRAYIVMVRMNYQSKLRVITQRIADERTKQLQDHIDKIMKALTSKYDNDLIKEYFQNHLKRLEFKI